MNAEAQKMCAGRMYNERKLSHSEASALSTRYGNAATNPDRRARATSELVARVYGMSERSVRRYASAAMKIDEHLDLSLAVMNGRMTLSDALGIVTLRNGSNVARGPITKRTGKNAPDAIYGRAMDTINTVLGAVEEVMPQLVNEESDTKGVRLLRWRLGQIIKTLEGRRKP